MPGFLLHIGAGMQCFHAAPATVISKQPKVLVGMKPVTTIDPTAIVATVTGCLFQVPILPTGTKPQPCVTVKWTQPSTRFKVNGLPAALAPSPGPGPGVCQSAEQIPQGAPIVGIVQTKVIGT